MVISGFIKNILVITIQFNSHWSVIAILNAGMINAEPAEDESEDPYEMEQPVLVLLDALKLHDALAIAKNVRTLLNHEWD